MYSLQICIVTDNVFFKMGMTRLIVELGELHDIVVNIVEEKQDADIIIRSHRDDDAFTLCKYFNVREDASEKNNLQKIIVVYNSTQHSIAGVGCCIDYAIPLTSSLLEFRMAVMDVIRQHQQKKDGRQCQCKIFHLSAREYHVMRKNGEGQSLAQIAREMSSDPKTISYYKRMAMRKLGIENNSDFFSYARFIADYEKASSDEECCS